MEITQGLSLELRLASKGVLRGVGMLMPVTTVSAWSKVRGQLMDLRLISPEMVSSNWSESSARQTTLTVVADAAKSMFRPLLRPSQFLCS